MHASWQVLAPRLPPGVLPRSGGTALSLPARDGFLLVGGYTEDAGPTTTTRAPTAEVLAIRLGGGGGSCAARLEGGSGDSGPPPRLAAAGATVGSTGWLIGGWDPGTKGDGGAMLGDVWSVALGGGGGGEGRPDAAAAPLRWTPHPVAPVPGGPVSRHAAAALPDASGRVVVFTHRCGPEVLVLHTSSSSPPLPDAGRGGRPHPPWWEVLAVAPDPAAGFPSSRGLASLVALSPTTLLLFGGAPKRGGMTNDLWRLVLPASGAAGGGARWERVGPPPPPPPPDGGEEGGWPPPRCSHVAAAVGAGGGGMAVIGGSFYDDASGGGLVARGDAWWWDDRSSQWSELHPGGDPPPAPRNAAAAAAVVGAGGREGVLVSGGWDPFRVTYGDSAVLWVGEGGGDGAS